MRNIGCFFSFGPGPDCLFRLCSGAYPTCRRPAPSVRLPVASTELESRRGPTGVIHEVFARTQASGIGQAGAAPGDPRWPGLDARVLHHEKGVFVKMI